MKCGRSRGFFFQAEDGIRDYKVTGVQTCALPISGEGFGSDSTSAPSAPTTAIAPTAAIRARGDRFAAATTAMPPTTAAASAPREPRSEEHTSELQSPCNLVCRLLLEKKKTIGCVPLTHPSHHLLTLAMYTVLLPVRLAPSPADSASLPPLLSPTKSLSPRLLRLSHLV